MWSMCFAALQLVFVFFWLTTYFRQGHNLDHTFEIHNKAACLTLTWYELDIEAKGVK